MAKVKLTEAMLKTLAPNTGEAQSYVWDTRTPGLGVVVGANTKTFVARRWVTEAGSKPVRRRVKLGTWPEMKLEDARAEAQGQLSQMAKGVDPNAEKKKARAGGPTVQEALTFHIGKMERGENRRGKVCSPRSIATLRGYAELHLADYLDGPLVALTTDVLDNLRTAIEKKATRMGGSNPKNPPGRASSNRMLSVVSAIWRSWHKRHGLPVSNPTERLIAGALAARDTRVGNADLPAWYARVMALENGVRRDLQLASMFSGVRAEGIRTLRFDDCDMDEELIHVTRAKGDRPYTIPMTATLREIIERRQTENAASKILAPFGGDGGYVFPSIARDGETVIPVAEVKERHAKRDARGKVVRDEDGAMVRENVVPGTHANRRTYNSVAMEIGISPEIRERLMNHSGRGVNVRHYGRPENWDHVRACADQVEAALWERIRGELKRGRKPALRAV